MAVDSFIDIAPLLDSTLPDPSLVDFYRGIARREIFWNQEITNDVLMISNHIINWNREDTGVPVEDRKPIKIFINSDGGDVVPTLNVVSVIKASKTPVYTIGMGGCYSSGGILLMSGHKRFIFDNTTCLIHDGSCGAFGDSGKVVDNVEFYKKIDVRVSEFIIATTKITKELLKENSRKDWFIFSDEMINLGIADKIVDSIDEIL